VAALMAIGCEELSELERLPFELKPRFDFGLLQPAAIAWKYKSFKICSIWVLI